MYKEIIINEKMGKNYAKVEFEVSEDKISKLSFSASNIESLLASLMYIITEFCEQFDFSEEKMIRVIKLAFTCCDDDMKEDDEEEKFYKSGTIELSGERAKEFIKFLEDINPGKHSKESEEK